MMAINPHYYKMLLPHGRFPTFSGMWSNMQGLKLITMDMWLGFVQQNMAKGSVLQSSLPVTFVVTTFQTFHL